MPEEHERRADRSEDEQERLNRQMIELLNELRVAMPGVQILFGYGGAVLTVLVIVGVIGGLWFVLPLTREATEHED